MSGSARLRADQKLKGGGHYDSNAGALRNSQQSLEFSHLNPYPLIINNLNSDPKRLGRSGLRRDRGIEHFQDH